MMNADPVPAVDPGDDAEWLKLTVELPRLDPERVWRLWTEAAGLASWWPPEAVTDLRRGGAYVFSWPAMGWHLRGTYVDLEPATRLAFTWRWDHEPDLPTRHVIVDIAPRPEGGSTLRLAHGAYGPGPIEATDRASHLDGWRHFLARLASLDA